MNDYPGRSTMQALHSLATLYPHTSRVIQAALWSGLDPPAAPIPAAVFDVARPILASQRLSPLAMAYLGSVGDSAKVPPGVRADAFALAATTASALANGVHYVTELERTGIPYVVAKGPSMAAYYERSQDRPFSDIDVLVNERDFRRAVGLATRLGFREDPASQQAWGPLDRWCREAKNMKNAAGGNIDIHHHVPPWLWGRRLSAERLIAGARAVKMAGHYLMVLAPEHNALVAALHVVSDKNRPGRNLLVWRDLVEAVRASDPEALLDEARHAGLQAWCGAVTGALPERVRSEACLPKFAGGTVPHPRRLAYLLSSAARDRSVAVTQPLRLPVANATAYLVGTAAGGRRTR